MFSNNEHWKERWVDEIECKFNSREIDLLNEHQNVEIRPKNKLLMESSK